MGWAKQTYMCVKVELLGVLQGQCVGSLTLFHLLDESHFRMITLGYIGQELLRFNNRVIK